MDFPGTVDENPPLLLAMPPVTKPYDIFDTRILQAGDDRHGGKLPKIILVSVRLGLTTVEFVGASGGLPAAVEARAGKLPMAPKPSWRNSPR